MLRPFVLKMVLASGLVLMPALAFSPTLTSANSQLAEEIDPDLLYRHVEILAGNPRPPATESEFAAGVYIENTLRSYGYQTKLQPFLYYTYRKPATLSLQVEGISGQAWSLHDFTFGPNGVANGMLVACGEGTAADYAQTDVRGKLVLVKRGGLPYGEKVRQAAAAGAAGLIIQHDQDQMWKGSLGAPLDMAVPVIGISKSQGDLLHAKMKEGKVQASLKVDGALTIRHTSYSIVANRPATSDSRGQTVLLAARHDSMASTPGADQGASGVAVMLETARILAEQPSDTDIQVVSFGASTAGSQGAYDFTRKLADQDRDKIVAALVLDALGGKGAGPLVVKTKGGRAAEELLPVKLLQASGVQLGQSSDDVLSGDALLLSGSSVPTAYLTRGTAKQNKVQQPDRVESISREHLVEATQAVLEAVSPITDLRTTAYPIVKPHGQGHSSAWKEWQTDGEVQ